MSLPADLIQAVKDQRVVPFLGAGASKDAQHPAGLEIPDGNQLKILLCNRFLNGELQHRPLQEVAEICISESDIITFQNFIRDTFTQFTPSPAHFLLPQFQWRSIVTTNFDTLVEQGYRDNKAAVQELVPFFKNGQRIDDELRKKRNPVSLLKLHGSIDHSDDTSCPLIISSEQYVSYSKNRTRLFERFRDLGYENVIVFCGYSVTDPHVRQILFDLFDEGIARPRYYVVDPGISDYEIRYWNKHRITTIKMTFADFLTSLGTQIPKQARALSLTPGQERASIAKFYKIANAQESPELLSFLEVDVKHIRRGMPTASQQAKAFYAGYDTGWGCIEQELDISRNLTDTLVTDAILSDEDERSDLVEIYVVKGAAGSGKSILLKRAAWEAAATFDKLVLYVNDQGAIRVPVLREISDLVQARFFLFIDHVSLRVQEVLQLVEYANANKIPITIVAAERDFEWNSRCEPLDQYVVRDYPLRNLSESEVEKLLEKLAKHGALGELTHLTPDERREAFLRRAERQLLVALHETTLGRPFEEIVTDEYRRIIPAEAQILYLDVCTLNQLGVPVRAGLINRISGISFDNFKTNFLLPLEHVVRSILDKYSGDYLYFARHQHVAQMVFENVVVDPEKKFNQIVRVMQAMNLDYKTDDEAFRQLMRGRQISKMFGSVELGRALFEVARKIAGDSPHFLQQEAIFEMSSPDGDLNKSEALLNEARELAPHDKAIQHSVAFLMRQKALATTNTLQRDHLRNRAREELNKLVKGQRQQYAMHTVGLIALDELKEYLQNRSGKDLTLLEEQRVVDLISEIEDTITQGLQAFPDETQFLTLDADFRNVLRQHDRAEKALQKAFEKNQRLEWVALRLAKRLINDHKVDEAIGILKRCLLANPTSKLVHMQLAMLYQEYGSPAEASLVLDHLRRSFIEGDGNYDAQFWYARELFINKKYVESMALFKKLRHAPVPANTKNRIRALVLGTGGKQTTFDGRVIKKEESYCFVQSPQFQDSIFAHISQSPREVWDHLLRNSDVCFVLGFSLKGPEALNLTIKA